MASPGIKRILTIIVAVCVALTTTGQSANELQEGDLLFCCTDTANAITAVTSGVEGLPIDHVAVFHRIGGENGIPFVIEAVKPSVQLTPLDTFLCQNPHVITGRVNADFYIQQSVRRCLAMVGKPYDDLYLPGDSAIYCSELVQLNYRSVSNRPIFEPIPMSFHDSTRRVTDYWRDFYGQRGMIVPEGAPGTNPGELSRRPQITIIGRYR
jgi:hypothetical protein